MGMTSRLYVIACRGSGACVFLAFFNLLLCKPAAAQESGYQTIRGTRVFTQINHAACVATFSNECGSQTLTQGQLQNGAYPDQIIPCPRPSANPAPTRIPSAAPPTGGSAIPSP